MSSFGMLATALSPYVMGVAFDLGASVSLLAWISAGYLGSSAVLVWLVVYKYWDQPHLEKT